MISITVNRCPDRVAGRQPRLCGRQFNNIIICFSDDGTDREESPSCSLNPLFKGEFVVSSGGFDNCRAEALVPVEVEVFISSVFLSKRFSRHDHGDVLSP